MDTLPPIRVAMADDHPLYRDGLRTMIQSLPGMQLVGEATDAEAAIDLVARLQPDVLLLDLEMPGGGGIRTLEALREKGVSTAVLILTMHEDDASVVTSIRAGARGYLPKSADRLELARAIAACAAGGMVFGSHVSDRMAELIDRSPAGAPHPFPSLTPRERDVLDRLARGEDNETIARVLGLSQKTVRNQVSMVLNKLAVSDRSAAIVLAREAGLGRD
jgi:DNA-binding NarL/FixJ family response regulator